MQKIFLSALVFLMTMTTAYAASIDMARLYSEAEKGNAQAQSTLGTLYQWGGQGVAINYSEAIKWLSKAAEQKNAEGFSGLAYAYREGKGVPQDLVKAYAYYMLAASSEGWGKEDASRHMNELSQRLTPDQLAEAKKFVNDWLANHAL